MQVTWATLPLIEVNSVFMIFKLEGDNFNSFGTAHGKAKIKRKAIVGISERGVRYNEH